MCLAQWMYASTTSTRTHSSARRPGTGSIGSPGWLARSSASGTIRARPLMCSPIRARSKSIRSRPACGFSAMLPSEACTPLPRYSG
jgi:hypothetical protein